MAVRIVFSHGNSFPASTYRVLLDNLRQRGFKVDAVEKFGHDPDYPVTNNWPHLVEQLADFARQKQGAGEAAFLVGHSLGGILSLMCAARHPELARGVVLIDSPVIGGWRATTLGLAKRTPLIGSLSPGRISHKRRHHSPRDEAAPENSHPQKAFAPSDPQGRRRPPPPAHPTPPARGGPAGPRLSRQLPRHSAVSAGALPDHVCQPAVDHPSVRRFLYC